MLEQQTERRRTKRFVPSAFMDYMEFFNDIPVTPLPNPIRDETGKLVADPIEV